MNINDLKKLFDLILDEYQNNKLNGREFNLLFNQQQGLYYAHLLGSHESFQPGRPVPIVGIGMSESVRTSLSPFIKTATLSVPSGTASKPSDYGRLASMTTAESNVDVIDHSQLASRRDSSIITTPFAIEKATSWDIYKTTASIALIYYPNKPTDVIWNSDNTTGREVYTSTGSVNPLWLEPDCYKIIARMLNVSGVALDDQFLIQYGQKVINTGQ